MTITNANLARHLTPAGEKPASEDTAYRAVRAMDARYGGSGHIEHTGTTPREPTYRVRFPFGERDGGSNVREDRFRKVAEYRPHAENMIRADSRSGAAVRKSPAPPVFSSLDPQEKPTTTPIGAQRRVVGVVVSREEGERAEKLKAAGLLDARTIAGLAVQYTDEEIDAAIRAAKSPGAGPGVIVSQLKTGAATTRVQEKAARVAKAQAATTPRPATPTPPPEPDTFNAAAHAARVDAVPFDALKNAIRAVVEALPLREAAVLTKRGVYSAEAFAVGDGTPGREALNKAATHPMIRAALAAHLDTHKEAAK